MGYFLRLTTSIAFSAAALFLMAAPTSAQQSSTVAVLLVGDGEGNTVRIAPAVAIKSDGVFLVPLDSVTDAKELQLRLQNGEIFDDVYLVNLDGRRNVAAIKIKGAEVTVKDSAGSDGLKPGDKLTVVTHSPGKLWAETAASVTGLKMATEVPGAGEGFRVLQFQAELPGDIDGGVVFDTSGQPLALMTKLLAAPTDSSFGVPIAAIKGLGDGTAHRTYGNGRNLTLPASSEDLKLARNPSKDPKDLLLTSKKVAVRSDTSLFTAAQLVTELKQRKEINDLGWVFLENAWDQKNRPDLIIDLDHQILTFNFTFTITHRRTSIVIASGKAIIADGAFGSKKMGDQIVKNLTALTGAKKATK